MKKIVKSHWIRFWYKLKWWRTREDVSECNRLDGSWWAWKIRIFKGSSNVYWRFSLLLLLLLLLLWLISFLDPSNDEIRVKRNTLVHSFRKIFCQQIAHWCSSLPSLKAGDKRQFNFKIFFYLNYFCFYEKIFHSTAILLAVGLALVQLLFIFQTLNVFLIFLK